jgi:hypothetical protein
MKINIVAVGLLLVPALTMCNDNQEQKEKSSYVAQAKEIAGNVTNFAVTKVFELKDGISTHAKTIYANPKAFGKALISKKTWVDAKNNLLTLTAWNAFMYGWGGSVLYNHRVYYRVYYQCTPRIPSKKYLALLVVPAIYSAAYNNAYNTPQEQAVTANQEDAQPDKSCDTCTTCSNGRCKRR